MSEGIDRHTALSEVIASGAVDANWYLQQNPDVALARVDPVRHYVFQGWKEGRDPSPFFSTREYVANHPDVLELSVCPLYHHLASSRQTGLTAGSTHSIPQVSALEKLAAVRDGWVSVAELDGWSEEDLIARRFSPATSAPTRSPATVVAHYLPQFHEIPENSKWWGDGFTEWTNVRRGEPRFEGHYQPHIPVDGDFYDLTDVGVLRKQASLARLHGIDAFCFYAYRFGSTSLLEQPLKLLLANKDIDIGYCLCWANESWTRSWDGDSGEVLMEQVYSADNDASFIANYAKYLVDPRYMRVAGRPVLLVYRPLDLPNSLLTTGRWRARARDMGIGELHLVAVEAFEAVDPISLGFDASVEFWPNNGDLPDVTPQVAGPHYEGKVYDWLPLMSRSYQYSPTGKPLYRSTCLGWDNDARRPRRGVQVVGATPHRFRNWLLNAAREQLSRSCDDVAPVVFINAWNEWAEGCHLEPDKQWGFEWLHAVRDVQQRLSTHEGDSCSSIGAQRVATTSASSPTQPDVAGRTTGVVVVLHDLHPHGAQFLGLALAEEVQRLGIPVEVLALAPGPLLARGHESVPIHLADWNCLEEELAGLYARGFRAAILNSVAAGDAVQSLRDQGFRTLCLVNEMPSIISELGLEQAAAAAGAADVCIFPADIVQRRYPFPVSNYRVLPQGLLDRSLLAREHNSRRWGSPDYGIPKDIPVVLAAGYADERKGFDLFVSAAKESLARGLPIHFAWVGKVADHVPVIRDALAALQGLPNVTLIEFSDDYGAVLELATVFALTSREDPFPNVVVDATAVGMPVVAFRDCSGVEALVEATHGALASAMTAEALLEAISKVLPTAASQELVVERKRYIAWRHNLTDYVGRLMETLGVNGQPEVSVAIPAFNHAPYIRERIESVIGQEVEPSEIILIDDASVDETYGRAMAALRTFRGPALTIQRSDNSGSVFRSWNSAVSPARRPFVWIAESDDACEPDFVSRMLEFQSHSDAAMTFCMARPIGEHSEPLAHSYELYLSEVFPDHDWSVPRIFEPGEFLQFAAVANPVLTVSSCLFKTEALQAALARCQEVGARLPSAGDWLTYMEVGAFHRVAYLPEVLCHHRRHQGSVVAGLATARHVDEINEVHEWILGRSGDAEGLRARQAAFRYSILIRA